MFCEVYELLKDLNSGPSGPWPMQKKATATGPLRTPRTKRRGKVKASCHESVGLHAHNGRLRPDEGATSCGTRSMPWKVDHPSIVHLREAWEPTRLKVGDGVPRAASWGVLRAIDGVYKATEQILRAVSYLHARRVLHRDLKLANVMVTDQQDWYVTIVDLGLVPFPE